MKSLISELQQIAVIESQVAWLRKTTYGLALSTLLIFPHTTQAQVNVSPLVIEAKSERGQAQDMITITNRSNTPSRIRVYAKPFTYNRDTGFKTLPANSPNDLTPYLQFSPRELTIQPGQTRRVRILTRLAPNLPEGEYRAVVFNENLAEKKDINNQAVNLLTRIGVTVYVVKGNVAPNLAVDSASFDSQQKKIQLLVRNTGKATARPGVVWKLRRGETVVKSGEIEAVSIIAQSDRQVFLGDSPQDIPNLTPGTYQLSGELVWGENKQNKLPFSVNFAVPSPTANSGQK